MTQQPHDQPAGEQGDDEQRPRLTSDPDEGTGPSLTMTDDVRGEQISPVDAARAVNPGGGPQIDPDEEEDVTGAGIR